MDEDRPQGPVFVDVSRRAAQPMPLTFPEAHPDLYWFPDQGIPEAEPVSCDITFMPADKATRKSLDAEQPVLVLIFDALDPDDAIVLLTELDRGVSGELYPGSYGLVALVYTDEDLDEVDAIGTAEFDVEEDEGAFTLSVAISSDEDEIAELLEVD